MNLEEGHRNRVSRQVLADTFPASVEGMCLTGARLAVANDGGLHSVRKGLLQRMRPTVTEDFPYFEERLEEGWNIGTSCFPLTLSKLFLKMLMLLGTCVEYLAPPDIKQS